MPIYDWVLAPVLIFFENRRAALLEERDLAIARYRSKKSASGPKMTKSHLFAPATAIRKFTYAAGLSRFDTMGLGIIFAEGRDRVGGGEYYQ